MQIMIEIVLMLIAPAVVLLDVYIIKADPDSLFVIFVSLILNLATVLLTGWFMILAKIDGHTLPEYLESRKVWRIAERLERERCAREYGQPRRLTEVEWRSKLANEIMTRKNEN